MTPIAPVVDVETARRDLLALQHRIVSTLSELDGQAFRIDDWEKPPGASLGGSGRTAILEEGELFERAGVGFSHVTGRALPPSATASRPELAGRGFEALGVSLVLHPRNPHVPTVHMNVRLFVARATHALDVWWTGGGMDLTPYYGRVEDARHFHQVCHDTLERFGPALYPRFKAWCDQYFFLKHRNEARGIGGIFFDDFNELGFADSYALMHAVGSTFLPAYVPIVERRRNEAYTEAQRQWQALRRGRYVEFNLVYDRGTLFGLQSGGRVESILMSLPPKVEWHYAAEPAAGSAEAALLTDFLPARDWLA